MNLTIRNIPDDVIKKIRTLSQMEKRSLNNEILFILERGIQAKIPRSTFGKDCQMNGRMIELHLK